MNEMSMTLAIKETEHYTLGTLPFDGYVMDTNGNLVYTTESVIAYFPKTPAAKKLKGFLLPENKEGGTSFKVTGVEHKKFRGTYGK